MAERKKRNSESEDPGNGDTMPWAVKLGVGVLAAGAFGAAAFGLYKLMSSGDHKELEVTQGGAASAARPHTALQVLEDVLKRIRLQRDQVLEANRVMTEFVQKEVVEAMRDEYPLYNRLYQNIAWTGSFYEGLKVGPPDEYDVNIILKLPCNLSDLNVVPKKYADYMCIKNFKQALQNIPQNKLPQSERSEMEKWCDNEGTLRQDKVRQWYEGLLHKHLNNGSFEEEHGLEVKVRKNGPAFTLTITKRDWYFMSGQELNVDLVPVIEFPESFAPPKPFRNLPKYNVPWYLVPKMKNNENTLWRASFCQQEKKIMKDTRCVKPVVRLMKKLRDTKKWYFLCSYYIKTIALWELHDDQNQRKLSHMKLDDMFMFFLKKLHGKLAQGNKDNFTCYWDPNCKLLDGVDDITIYNAYQQLGKVIKKFETNYQTNPSVFEDEICNGPICAPPYKFGNVACTWSCLGTTMTLVLYGHHR